MKSNNAIFIIIIQLALFIIAINSQVRLNLTKGYFSNTNNPSTTNNGFLAENPSDIATDTVDNSYYTVTANIGKGNQPFSLVIDTAVSVLWVSAVNLESNSPNHFDCNDTNTCDVMNYLFPVGYSNGNTIRGSIIEDTVDLGNGTVVQNQAMILLSQNISLVDFPTDGIFGLGFKTSILGIPVGITPVLDNMQQEGLVPNKSFSVFLANNTNTNGQSDLILGGYDPSHMSAADFAYYPLYDGHSWQISVNSVTFNGNSFSSSSPMLFDTRAGGIQAPSDAFSSILSLAQTWDPSCAGTTIGALTVIQCSCSGTTSYPNISFVFNASDNQIYTISGEQYIYRVNGSCIIDVAKSSNWAVGHQFMQNYYMYFDEDNQRIGIAPAASS
jgi:hypothetical protein